MGCSGGGRWDGWQEARGGLREKPKEAKKKRKKGRRGEEAEGELRKEDRGF